MKKSIKELVTFGIFIIVCILLLVIVSIFA